MTRQAGLATSGSLELRGSGGCRTPVRWDTTQSGSGGPSGGWGGWRLGGGCPCAREGARGRCFCCSALGTRAQAGNSLATRRPGLYRTQLPGLGRGTSRWVVFPGCLVNSGTETPVQRPHQHTASKMQQPGMLLGWGSAEVPRRASKTSWRDHLFPKRRHLGPPNRWRGGHRGGSAVFHEPVW